MNMHKLQKLFALILTLVLVMTVAAPIGANAATAWAPKTDTEIFWVKTADSDISDEDLEAQVKLFASELAEKTGYSLNITYGDASQAGANDIILVLDSTSGVAVQGYRITVDTAVTITASDADGLFYGCRYLIKELLRTGSVAAVSDAPWVGERAVSLDNGRKYFTVDWIKELVREMSWANMNTLVLHFSEEMGLGIESELYPWLAGRDGTLCVATDLGANYDGRFLTQEEVAEIIQYAKLYHIDVIPSLDSPGHMNYIVKKFNEKCAKQPFTFTYDGVTYTVPAGYNIGNYFEYNGQKTAVVPGSRNTAYSRGINIADEIAVAFTKSLIEEYATLFASQGCTKFDIGGDELLGWGSAVSSSVSKWKQLDHWKRYAQKRTGNNSAVAYDAFLLYMNDLNALVRDLGYTSVRMWNDDALRSSDTGWTGVVQLDTNIDIWFWTAGSNSNKAYTDAGYEVYNITETYCYYVLNDAYVNGTGYQQARPQPMYDYWNPYEFGTNSSGVRYYADWHDSDVLGGALGIWCDNPSLKTEAQMMEDLRPMIRVNAAKSWNAYINASVNYATHTANWQKYGNAPVGTVAAPEIYVIGDLTALEAAVTEYETVDGTLYTEESFADYTAAVTAGRNLLEKGEYTQAEVDAAVKTIEDAKAALEEKPKADIAALNAAISAYEKADAAEYTEESFADYTAAVTAGRNLLEKGEYTQAEVDAAVKAIEDAKAALEEKPKADIAALNAAISAYEKADAAEYTEESFADYTAAVTAGRNLLEKGEYTQAEVDAAVKAIEDAKAALEEKPKADTTALNAAISDYEKVNGAQYTPDSFAAYTTAVTAGKNLLNSGAYSQADVDAALAAINAAKAALAPAGEGVECILAGSAQSSSISVNKVATFTISTDKNVATKAVRVFDETGKEITPTRSSVNVRNSERDIYTFIFKVTAADRGTRTYTAYAVLENGTLSADSVQITITVR